MFFKRSMINPKRAFTMAELLLALVIIGVIAAVTLPMLGKSMPSKEETIHKKMSYIVEQVAAQLYDDDIMYAKKSDLFSQGFQNTDKVTINNVDYEGDTKFCELFASKFNKISQNVVCEDDKKSFVSTDNVAWYLPVTDFKEGSAEIMIDVNDTLGSNCLKDSADCKRPDRFKYYIKPNGTVTFEQPNDVLNDKFKILVDVTNPAGGTYAIAKLNPNGTAGAYNTGDPYFRDLDRNTRYIIRAYPEPGYFTDWQLNQRRVVIVNSDVRVKLNFIPRSTYCVMLTVANCDKTNIKQCANYKLKKGCNYINVGPKQGVYKLNDDGAFEYVGKYVDGGDYEYKCTGDTVNMTVGKPDFDPVTGEVVRDGSGNVQFDADAAALFTCDLMTGDYQIEVKPKNPYKIRTNLASGEDDIYLQDVRLGTGKLTFGVTLSQ